MRRLLALGAAIVACAVVSPVAAQIAAEVAAPTDSIEVVCQAFVGMDAATRETCRREAMAHVDPWLANDDDDKGPAPVGRALLYTCWRKAGRLDPELPSPRNYEIFPAAIAACERASRIDPSYLPAHVALGWLYFNSGRIDEAIRHLAFVRSVIAGRSAVVDTTAAASGFECCGALAWCYRAQGAWEQGLDAAEQGLRRQPEDPWLLVAKGLLLAGAGQVTEANAVAMLLPTLRVVHFSTEERNVFGRHSSFVANWIRAQAQLSDGRPDLAQSILAKQIDDQIDWLYMPFARAYWNDAGLVYELTRPAEAAEYYVQAYQRDYRGMFVPRSAIIADPVFAGLPPAKLQAVIVDDRHYLTGSPFAYVGHQLAAMERGAGTAAGGAARARVLAMVASLDARNIRRDFCHGVRGRVAWHDGDLALAKAELIAAREVQHRAGIVDPAGTQLLAQVCLQSGDEAGAEVYFREVVAASPEAAAAWQGLGVVLAKTGRNDEALAAMDRAITAAPRSTAGWYNRGLFHYSQGHYDDAERDLRRALALAPERADIINMLQSVAGAKKGP